MCKCSITYTSASTVASLAAIEAVSGSYARLLSMNNEIAKHKPSNTKECFWQLHSKLKAGEKQQSLYGLIKQGLQVRSKIQFNT